MCLSCNREVVRAGNECIWKRWAFGPPYCWLPVVHLFCITAQVQFCPIYKGAHWKALLKTKGPVLIYSVVSLMCRKLVSAVQSNHWFSSHWLHNCLENLMILDQQSHAQAQSLGVYLARLQPRLCSCLPDPHWNPDYSLWHLSLWCFGVGEAAFCILTPGKDKKCLDSNQRALLRL